MNDSTLDPDTAFDLLSNERRRQLLCLLAQRGERLSLQTVAREIIARIEDTDTDAITEETYRSVYVSLYQNHVPRLADAGIVHYDEQDRTVELAHTPRTRELLRLLGSEFTDRWRNAYLAVIGLGSLMGAASYLGLLPTVGTVWLLPGVVLAVGLAGIGIHQYYTRNRITIDDCATMETRSSRRGIGR